MLVPNAALRYKPADSEIQKPPSTPAQAQIHGNAPKNDGEPALGGSKSGKPKRDTFAGKVYVLENGKLKPVNVTLGITDNRNTEIVGGDIKAGDQVVIGEEQGDDKSAGSGSRPPMRLF